MTYDTKEFLNKIKLLFSTLFNRTMPYVVIGNPDKEDHFLFTSVDPDEIEILNPNPDVVIHDVIINDKNFQNDLYEKFPVLKNYILILFVRDFLSFINKNKNLDIEMFVHEGHVYIRKNEKTEEENIQCGIVVSEYITDRYVDLIKAIKDKSDKPVEPYEYNLSVNLFNGKRTTVKTYTDINQTYAGKCFLSPGFNTIALDKYLGAYKQHPEYSYKLISWSSNKDIRCETLFTDNFVSVVSVQPFSRWYAK